MTHRSEKSPESALIDDTLPDVAAVLYVSGGALVRVMISDAQE